MATRNLTAVEGLRFLLFLGIFVFNCVNSWLPIGWGGVEAFLVIGAFFLTRKQLKFDQEQIHVGKSFVYRIKRLYPAYILLVLIASAGYIYAKKSLIAESLWYILSLQNFRCLFDTASYSLDFLLGHFWYIGLDVWLFLIWLIILRLVKKEQLKAAFITTLIIGLIWRTTFILLKPDNPSLAYVIPVGQLDSWSIGGLIALNVNNKGQNSKLMWSELLVGFAGILLLIVLNAHLLNTSIADGYLGFRSAKGYMSHPLTGNIHLFIAILSAGLLRYCLDEKRRHPILSSVPLVALGGMTYELYCFHYPIKVVVKHFINNEVLMVVVALIATYLVTVLWNKLAMPVVHKIIR